MQHPAKIVSIAPGVKATKLKLRSLQLRLYEKCDAGLSTHGRPRPLLPLQQASSPIPAGQFVRTSILISEGRGPCVEIWRKAEGNFVFI